MHESHANDQREAQRFLRDNNIMIDPADGRSEIEVAMALGFLPVHGAGAETPEDK